MSAVTPGAVATGATDAVARVASEPYPWPWDGLRPAELVLVVAGWDRHWEARVEVAARRQALEQLERLAAAVVAVGGSVVAVAHDRPRRAAGHLPLPESLPPPATDPAARSPHPQGGTGERVVRAAGIDAFCGSDLDTVLRRRGATQLILGGFGLEAPVHSTLRSANDRGYECLLVTDAAAPLDPALCAAATSQICMSGGIFGAVAPTDAVVGLLAAAAPSVSAHLDLDPDRDPVARPTPTRASSPEAASPPTP